MNLSTLAPEHLDLISEALKHEAEWCREEAYSGDEEWIARAEKLDEVRHIIDSLYNKVAA